MPRRRPRAPVPAPDPWSPVKLLRLAVAGAMVALLLLAGLGYRYLTRERPAAAAPAAEVSPPRTGPARRDVIAAAPMSRVPPVSLQDPAPAAGATPSPVLVPSGTGLGPARVPTGFPNTPEGAIGQLAALTGAVIDSMSLPYTQEVYTAWALPGGPGPAAWPMTGNVQAFLAAARMGPVKSPRATILTVPVAAQLKGSDGPGWQLPCVLLQIRASNPAGQSRQLMYGYCERMQWSDGRWRIAPGDPPAPAPATWPDTATAAAAGWRPWSAEPHHD